MHFSNELRTSKFLLTKQQTTRPTSVDVAIWNMIEVSVLAVHTVVGHCEGKLMVRRTYENDGRDIETAAEIDDLVNDKREGWRANRAKARRRQRRYKKRLASALQYRLDDEATTT